MQSSAILHPLAAWSRPSMYCVRIYIRLLVTPSQDSMHSHDSARLYRHIFGAVLRNHFHAAAGSAAGHGCNSCDYHGFCRCPLAHNKCICLLTATQLTQKKKCGLAHVTALLQPHMTHNSTVCIHLEYGYITRVLSWKRCKLKHYRIELPFQGVYQLIPPFACTGLAATHDQSVNYAKDKRLVIKMYVWTLLVADEFGLHVYSVSTFFSIALFMASSARTHTCVICKTWWWHFDTHPGWWFPSWGSHLHRTADFFHSYLTSKFEALRLKHTHKPEKLENDISWAVITRK